MSNKKSTYPKRPRFFAHQFVRLLTKAAAAQQIGPEACWLLAVIVHQEDAVHYRRGVTFYNEQLLPLCGFGSKKRLVEARRKAIDAGLLYYEAGGKSTPGTYWVLVPKGAQRVSDGPCDAGDDDICRSESERQRDQETICRSVSERKPHPKRNGKGSPFNPTPVPTPNLSSAAPPAPEDEAEGNVPKTPQGFFDRWNRFATAKGLRVAKVLSKERAVKIKQRLNTSGWFELFEEALTKLPVPNDERFTWQPDLDWLIGNNTNAAMVAEGKYDNRGHGTAQRSGAPAPALPASEYAN